MTNQFQPPARSVDEELGRRSPTDRQRSPDKVKREVVVFLIGLGVLLGIASVLAFNGLERAPDIFGMRRSTFFGGLCGFFALAHAVPAILFARTDRSGFAVLGAAANTLLSFTTLVLFGWAGVIGVIIQVVMPLVVWNRVAKLNAPRDGTRRRPHPRGVRARSDAL